ncbi:non-SMC mitotic condensation complex subunit 1-domain-containing protein [Radiomyces spectabilis]|uniref:non-SMC mitotic condensation complex subunit 1-domain-containing protein n=1 Tax=Radiomyces spectabilis TaxID=64574 RepID=UPI00221EE24A|nr:non-SMC mitotic condensation complex subunit 1-domain-containing protein [Radiomyces spectabilis]KAI8393588.1 non-SMC mitotic condensation complex subunit 1-domain-containing protein [Radiomyces spectabilis]
MEGQFILHDEIVRLQDKTTAEYYIPNEMAIAGQSDHELARYLNDITDRIEVSSDAIVDPIVFDKIRSFLKNLSSLNQRICNRLLDILLSAFKSEIRTASDDLDNNEKDTFAGHRQHLELYSFLIYWFLTAVEEKSSGTTTKSKKGKHRSDDANAKDYSTQKAKAFDAIGWLLELKLGNIWTLTPERNTFITLFTKPAYQVFENPHYVKSSIVKTRAFKILSLCIKNYGHLSASQTTIMQTLQYWEHSAEPMAEFLQYLVNQHDYRQLADEILREISNKEFKDTTTKELKDTPNAKTFAIFLQKLAELSPKTILKNLGLLIHQLDSESYTMRIALIDILGMLIVDLTENGNDSPSQKDQINGFFDILEERMLDPISFVRSKVLQTYLRLLNLRAKFPKRRHALGVLTIRHLEDKSSSVRKYAIRTLTKLMATHPYSMYGGELDLVEWGKRFQKIQEELENVTRPAQAAVEEVAANNSEEEAATNTQNTTDNDTETNNQSTEDSEAATEDVEMSEASQSEPIATTEPESTTISEPATIPEPVNMVSPEKLQQLNLMRAFHADAIRFIQQIHTAIPTICQILSSKSKAEVIEAMDFLVTAYNYKIKEASTGIKKMLHLIWTKDTSDEGKGVKMKLLECYRNLYLEMDAKLSSKENINVIARNLIQLTYNTTVAELTSLEQVLSTLMPDSVISDQVIYKLWSVYAFKGNIPKSQRRGAIIILGMLAKANTEIISGKIDLLLRVGLGRLGKADLSLAKYSCIALQRLAGTKSEKVRGVHEGVRLPMTHPIFARLKDIIESSSDAIEWFSLTEQAINTVYLLGEHPDTLCAEIIKTMSVKVFGLAETENSQQTEEGLPNSDTQMDIDYNMSLSQQALPYPHHPTHRSSFELSQLIFIVGHVALKQIVYLEIVEAVCKRKKSAKEDNEQRQTAGQEDELEQVGGTAEDDIVDAMTHIREREILFGPNSLLARYGPLLTEICSYNKVYTDRVLQMTATLALAKFMCVSSDFCEKNLRLLFTILEKSKNATIRSNIVIALGDMAVCFNTLLDENITFLYNRLGDKETVVKKNAVMVLTHLILNGMVKVKGQISEMAKCLEDPDQRIADLAKLFFTELATKDNAIYNNLPDMISNLTTGANRVEEESFHKIMKFIFSFDFAEKEKQAENVVDKLCQRFQNTDDERTWRDIAFCLSLLPFKSERSYRKLLESLPMYQDKLHVESVHKSFLEIVAKGRAQKLQKPELKSVIDELEQKLEKQSEAQEQNETTTQPRKASSSKRVLRSSRSKKQTNVSTPKTPTRRRKRALPDTDDESEDDQDMPDLDNDETEDDDDDDIEEDDDLVEDATADPVDGSVEE